VPNDSLSRARTAYTRAEGDLARLARLLSRTDRYSRPTKYQELLDRLEEVKARKQRAAEKVELLEGEASGNTTAT
jgi:hypothetical protein